MDDPAENTDTKINAEFIQNECEDDEKVTEEDTRPLERSVWRVSHFSLMFFCMLSNKSNI